jgi:hypothetical protein
MRRDFERASGFVNLSGCCDERGSRTPGIVDGVAGDGRQQDIGFHPFEVQLISICC